MSETLRWGADVQALSPGTTTVTIQAGAVRKTIVVVVGSELLTNGGFETAGGWGLNQSELVRSNNTLLPHSGEWFLNSIAQNQQAAWQTVQVTPGAAYRLEAWLASGAVGREQWMEIRSNNSVLKHVDWTAGDAYTWEKRTLDFTVTDDVSSITVVLGGSWPRIDDVSLWRVG